MKITRFLPLLAALWLFACTLAPPIAEPTPLADDYIPTAIALTLEAGETPTSATDEPVPATERSPQESTPMPASTPAPTVARETALPVVPTFDPLLLPTAPPPTPTPASNIPDADIQIYRPGDGSKVASPLRISAYLKLSEGGQVRIELLGEDGRVLVEQLKDYATAPGVWTNLSPELNFGISAAAEAGRLVIRVDDKFGRIASLNSVNLILLSVGEADINPVTADRERILIEQPQAKALIMGGTLLVSGLVRPASGRPLRAELIDEEGNVVGMRLAGVKPPTEGEWWAFAAEVPYRVEELTSARLVVYEEGGTVSDMAYLVSSEVLLSP